MQQLGTGSVQLKRAKAKVYCERGFLNIFCLGQKLFLIRGKISILFFQHSVCIRGQNFWLNFFLTSAFCPPGYCNQMFHVLRTLTKLWIRL